MSNSVLVIGGSGTGKSRSLKGLMGADTFLINVMDKSLPFKGFKKHFKPLSPKGDEGNYYSSDDSIKILRVMRLINEKRPDIKNLIIDDFQYTMCSEFMRRASEKSYDKFTDIGKNAWNIVREMSSFRGDLFSVILSHSDIDANGTARLKTIGRLLDDKVVIEGLFTIVLHSLVADGEYKFLTQHNGCYLAKSPEGMFDTYIDNNLEHVRKSIDEYEQGDD